MNLNKKGFTLIELVVTIAILLMLATVAVLSVKKEYDKSKEDINIIQKKMLDQAIKSYVLENCDTSEICTINEGDLNDYFDDSDNIPDINYPITSIIHENGKLVSTHDKRLSAVILSGGLAKDEFDKSTYYDDDEIPEVGGDIPNDKGIYEKQDADGTTYFFRGKVDNNYVDFAGYIWRIVRINGDGSIRLLMYPQINYSSVGGYEKIAFNENNDNEKYVGYTYDNSRKCTGGKLNELCDGSEGKDSTIKAYLDEWYKNNLSDYDKYITASRFCNDTTTFEDTTWNIVYGSYKRFITNDPTYICPDTDKGYGGEYKLKIGLLSFDEYLYSMTYGVDRRDPDFYYMEYYTYIPTIYGSASAFSISPAMIDTDEYLYLHVFAIYTYKNDNSYAVLAPVINLKLDVIWSSGNGTWNNPYKIVTE